MKVFSGKGFDPSKIVFPLSLPSTGGQLPSKICSFPLKAALIGGYLPPWISMKIIHQQRLNPIERVPLNVVFYLRRSSLKESIPSR